MSRRHLSFPLALRSALVCALATWVTMWSWHAFTALSARFVVPLLALGLLTAFTGATARWAHLPRGVILLIQFMVVGTAANLFALGVAWPVGPGASHAAKILQDAVDTANTYTPPVPASAPSMAPILILAGAASLVLMDLIAESFGRVAIAGLGLLAIYTVPVTLVSARPSWVQFVLAAGAYLWLLFLHESDRLDRWGRSLEGPTGVSDRDYRQTWVMSSTAGTVATVTLAIAVVLPFFIPTLHLALGGFGFGDGGTKVQVINPITDLRRDLQRGDNVPLLTIRTNDPAPSYMRISVLNRFLSDQWSSGNREIPTSQRVAGPLPPITDVPAGLPRQTYSYDVTATSDFSSTWLPIGELTTAVTAPTGDWRYDLFSRDVIAANHDTNTAGTSWSYTAIQPEYDVTALQNASPIAADIASEDEDLPPNFPYSVRSMAMEVTQDGRNAFEKAVILQDWFRTNFRYSIARAPSGNGSATLVGFLDPKTGRIGYCEQFASAMAAMARALGIPARVAVGFLSAHPTGPGTFTYYTNDMHAWPELYFAGSGWVRFEPTPPTRASGVPAYTNLNVSPGHEPTTKPTSSRAVGHPTTTQSITTPAKPTTVPHEATPEWRMPWAIVAMTLAILLLLALFALAPGWVRRRRTHRRLASGAPESMWIELRDTCLDLGLPWPAARSPRSTGSQMAEHFGRPVADSAEVRPAHGARLNPEATQALGRIVDLVERGRYAAVAPVVDPARLRADAQQCREALLGGATTSRRRRARWLPASLFGAGNRVVAPSEPTPSGTTERLKVDA